MKRRKRGTALDGARDAYHIHQAQEALTAISRASRDTLWEIGNFALMVVVLAFIAGLVYFLS
jgi:hypothetical protein